MHRTAAFCLLSLASLAPAQNAVVEHPWLKNPVLGKNRIAFLLKSQLWIADRNGRNAHKALAQPGRQWTPAFSPDGTRIAFQAEFDGNLDIYTMPDSGGTPTRLTHFPMSYKPISQWSPQGIVCAHNGLSFTGLASQIYLVSPQGGMPTKLPVNYGVEGALSPDGRYLAFTPLVNNLTEFWFNYRGGMHRNIWVLDRKTQAVRQVTFAPGTDCQPMWHGNGTILFLSDMGADNRRNLWSVDLKSGRRKQLTHLTGYDLWNPSYSRLNGGEVAFEYGAQLLRYSMQTGKTVPIQVQIPREAREIVPREVDAARNLAAGTLSSDGAYAIYEARGDLWRVQVDHDPENVTNTSGVFERAPACSPDGRSLAYFSDQSGENQLWVLDLATKSKRMVTRFKAGYFTNSQWAPDSKRIAYIDQANRILVTDIATGATLTAGQDTLATTPPFDWSRDSGRIFYVANGANRIPILWSFDLTTKRTAQLTYGAYADDSPALTNDRLYFLSARDYNQFRFDATEGYYAIVGGRGVYSVSIPNPTLPEAFEKSMAALPIRSGQIFNLSAIGDRYLLYIRILDTGEQPLVAYDLRSKQEKTVVANVSTAPILNAARSHCLVQTPDGSKIVRLDGDFPVLVLRMSPMKARISPRDEWKALARDDWRICRDYFYNPQVPPRDWNRIWNQAQPLVQASLTHFDLNDALCRMHAELATGHAYMQSQGDIDPPQPAKPIGMLGCDFGLKNGQYVIEKIYEWPWYVKRNAPLTGSRVAKGDALVAVAGKPVDVKQDPWAAFQGLANQDVDITVRKPSGKMLTAKVRTIDSEVALRYECYIDSRRKLVERLSGGRLAYMHVKSFNTNAIPDFKRQLDLASSKDGLVLDIRWSTGGFLSGMWAQMLARAPLAAWAVRDGWYSPSGGRAPAGPVAYVVNAMTISAGEGMSNNLRKLNIGRSFGARTWGGYVGLGGTPALVDGSLFNVPNGPFFDGGKWLLENRGFVPDEQIPDDKSGLTDPQLERAVRWAMSELKKHGTKSPVPPPMSNLQGHP